MQSDLLRRQNGSRRDGKNIESRRSVLQSESYEDKERLCDTFLIKTGEKHAASDI